MEVKVARLDDFGPRWTGRQCQLLKIDVQGYEYPVLLGARETLKTCRYVYVECSERELYQGQVLRADIFNFLKQNGFVEMGRYNPVYHDGSLIQADYAFGRAI